MEFLFTLLEHFVGDDTDPVDLLPLLVLGALGVGMRQLRLLMLEILKELGGLKERINVADEIRRELHTLLRQLK